MLLFSSPILAPLLLLAVATYARQSPGRRPCKHPIIAEYASLGAFGIALLSGFVLLVQGPGMDPFFGLFGVGLSALIDAVSTIMLILAAFVGWASPLAARPRILHASLQAGSTVLGDLHTSETHV